MKALIVVVFAFGLLVLACSKAAQEQAQTGNPSFKVDLLFEHEGCKVFRFEDAGRNRYFTNCQGGTAWSETHTCGKNCSRTEDHNIPTTRTPKKASAP
jgi:hypothetical protein